MGCYKRKYKRRKREKRIIELWVLLWTDFWNIIDKAKEAKNAAEIYAIIYRELNQLKVEELVLYSIFYALFNKAYTWNLWNVASIIQGGCGDDAFMDFRKRNLRKILRKPWFCRYHRKLRKQTLQRNIWLYTGGKSINKKQEKTSNLILYFL